MLEEGLPLQRPAFLLVALSRSSFILWRSKEAVRVRRECWSSLPYRKFPPFLPFVTLHLSARWSPLAGPPHVLCRDGPAHQLPDVQPERGAGTGAVVSILNMLLHTFHWLTVPIRQVVQPLWMHA
jgi:hypothetical protein